MLITISIIETALVASDNQLNQFRNNTVWKSFYACECFLQKLSCASSHSTMLSQPSIPLVHINNKYTTKPEM